VRLPRHPLPLLGLMLLALVIRSDASVSRPAPAGRAVEPVALVAASIDPVASLRRAACNSVALSELASRSDQQPCARPAAANSSSALSLLPAPRVLKSGANQMVASPGDGTLVDRLRIFTDDLVAMDLVAYRSSGLIVGGLLCYVDDGQPRSTILHLHSGLGGIFVDPIPVGTDMFDSCYAWASGQQYNVFVPSYRGRDGGQGQADFCMGEADDVANAAIWLRSLAIVDPNRLAVVGSSLGGCVALKAGVMIPNLRAVVAIAPPTDWRDMVDFHRNRWVRATETRCDGSVVNWDQGGPAFADVMDNAICGHRGCPLADYQARSPIPLVHQATNPTLVVVASSDNLVPASQQLLWSGLRNDETGAVAVEVRRRCAAPAAPALVHDALMYVPGAFHFLETGPIASSLLWMLDQLDAAPAPASAGL
jgi:acetyl esterase/lipase